jgi:hypothetical protein
VNIYSQVTANWASSLTIVETAGERMADVLAKGLKGTVEVAICKSDIISLVPETDDVVFDL